MEIDLELQEKEVFKEIVVDGEFETIAIWTDGDWAIKSSVHYEEKLQEGLSPIYFLNRSELTSRFFTSDQVEELIRFLEQRLNHSSATSHESSF